MKKHHTELQILGNLREPNKANRCRKYSGRMASPALFIMRDQREAEQNRPERKPLRTSDLSLK